MYFTDAEISELSSLLFRGRLGVFVGSGASRNAPISESGKECPAWDELLLHIADAAAAGKDVEEIRDIVDELRHADAPGLLRLASKLVQLRPKVHLETLQDLFLPLENCPQVVFSSLLHDLLIRLPWKTIVTTNFDLLLEAAAEQVFPSRKINKTVGFPKELPDNSSAINLWKIHGCAKDGSLVLTEEEFDSLYSSSHFSELLKSFLATNNLLFLGVGFRDPAICRIFSELKAIISPEWPTRMWAFVDEHEADNLSSLAGESIVIRTYRSSPRSCHVQLLRELVESTISALPDLPLECSFNRNRERSALARYVDNVSEGVPRGCLALVGDDTTDRRQFSDHWLRFECLLRGVELIHIDALAYSTPELLAHRLNELLGANLGPRNSPQKIFRELARNSGRLLKQPCILRIVSRPEMWGMLIQEFVVPVLKEQRRRGARFGAVMEFDSDRDLRAHASELFARRDIDSFEESLLRFTAFGREHISVFLRYALPLPPEVREHVQPLLEQLVNRPPRHFLDLLASIYQAISTSTEKL